MDVAVHRALSQLGIDGQARSIDRTVAGIGQMELHLAPHCPRTRVDALTLRVQFTGYQHVCTVTHQRGEIDTFHLCMYVIGFVVDVIIALQLRLAAFVLRIAVHVHTHLFQVHRRSLHTHRHERYREVGRTYR